MGYSQEKSSGTATRRSKKCKQVDADAGSELPEGTATKIRKGHTQLTPVTTGEEINVSAIRKEPSASMTDTSKLHQLIVDKDLRGKGRSGKDGERPKRFIVFIGNLPFTATTASISKHFASLKPASIRHITHKDQPTKSKGYAFLEFDGYDRMKTCLKLHHLSTFDDGLSAARKINVELTAGGGGAKSKERRAKLKTKNKKLNEERERRVQEEKAKQDKRSITEDASSVHPSRRGRVPAR